MQTHSLILAMLMIAGLSIFPASASPDSPVNIADSLPPAWTPDRLFSQTLPGDDDWWDVFDDPALSALIKQAESHNLDLKATAHQIELARISWESAKAAYFPTLSASAGYNRSMEAGKISGMNSSPTTGYFSLGLNMNWEIDIFGRIAVERKAGKAAFDYSKAEYTAAKVSLCANVAKAYFNLRSVQAQIETTIEQIHSQEKVLAMTQTRYDVGLVSKLDIAQANMVVYSSQASLPPLEALEKAAINSLALLCGAFPDNLAADLTAPAPLPNPYQMVKTGVPADLLRRRPDVVAAEFELARYAAEIGIAKKDFLPTLSLTGSIGTEAHRLDDLFASHSLSYSIAPVLSWTIFDGMARNYKVAEAKEQFMAGMDNYNSTIFTAWQEAQTAMDTYEARLRHTALIQKVNEQCDETLTLSIDRYKQGLTSFNDVVTAQLNTLNYRLEAISARAGALASLVEIYTALGGNPSK